MRPNKMKKPILYVLMLILLSACAPFSERGSNSQKTAMMRESVVPPGTVLQVNNTDGSRIIFTRDDIDELPTYEFQVENKTIQGKQVLKVLEAANVGDYQFITFHSRNQSVTLEKRQVRDNLVLLNNGSHFSMQLYSDSILNEQCIKDIQSISFEQ